MNRTDKVAVCSRSFSRHPILRQELLSRYQHVSFNDEGLKLEGDKLVKFLSGHQKAITALETISAEILAELPDLKVLSKYGVGVDMIDFHALKNHNIVFGWEAGVNKRSVSELVLNNMISLLRHVPKAVIEVRNGTWRQHIGRQLTGKKIGIIGCGNVGKDLVEILRPFSCPILAHDIVNYADFYKTHNVSPVDLDTLLKEAEIVTVHVPLDETTRNLLSAEKLKLMREDAILINAARGGIVDENAVKTALFSGKISGAAFDVFECEPPRDKELLSLDNFLVTPHIGGSSEEAVLAMGRAAIKGLEAHG